ncbi:S28 family serine protease [Streptomyces sp. NPDC060194]|uniref:S28 family serine protease n=1 Tax=Streptomyces sp. NPDC060194 TaxID=3347069 RepID=UPI0036623CAA
MRTALRWLVALAMLIGISGTTATGAATAAEPDIKERLLAIPGMSLVEEKPYTGYRYFVLNYTQPVDHRNPRKGTFQQRLTVLHKDTARPTVFQTSGYNVSTNPGRSEPTRIVDGNQVSMEYRFFTPSRPAPADWSKLTIWQAASDQHRIFQALNGIYAGNWLATGGSKGGMTATYYERFYPRDMDGVVAYVAPNDVVNDEDSAYDRFFRNVGTEECRTALENVEREALKRRTALSAKYQAYADAEGYTFTTTGSLDKSFEATVLDLAWGFWQYSTAADCADVPVAATASDQELYDYVDAIAGWSFYTDQGLAPYTPYYYQAGTQLGAPTIRQPHLSGLTRYGYQPPRTFVPREIPMRFDRGAMRDVDRWVQRNATRMLFVYGENDPWGAERFRPGRHTDDAYVFTAPGANHGANVAGLVPAEREKATAEILQWAGLPAAAVAEAAPLARYDAALDRQPVEREMTLRP